jgi:hypothetical protein
MYLPENLKERQQKDVPFFKITKEKQNLLS